MYADSSYAFATLHVHGVIYKERGLLTEGGGGVGEEIKNEKGIFQVLDAVWKPSQVAVSEELIQSAKEIGWLTRQPRRR